MSISVENLLELFLKEEKAQGAIEYVLLAGGIIVAAIVIFSFYTSITRSTSANVNESVNIAMGNLTDRIDSTMNTF